MPREFFAVNFNGVTIKIRMGALLWSTDCENRWISCRLVSTLCAEQGWEQGAQRRTSIANLDQTFVPSAKQPARPGQSAETTAGGTVKSTHMCRKRRMKCPDTPVCERIQGRSQAGGEVGQQINLAGIWRPQAVSFHQPGVLPGAKSVGQDIRAKDGSAV